jgi:adenylosuccinate lyase
MPFKRNPINTENMCSLARYIAGLPAVAWDNASQAILERSLDDSANRRIFQAEGFMAADELLLRMAHIVAEMVVDETAVARNMAIYGPFAATERVLMALVAAGGSRQDGHEYIREASLQAWAALREAKPNPLVSLLTQDGRITSLVSAEEVAALMDANAHTGTAETRARQLADTIRTEI